MLKLSLTNVMHLFITLDDFCFFVWLVGIVEEKCVYCRYICDYVIKLEYAYVLRFSLSINIFPGVLILSL